MNEPPVRGSVARHFSIVSEAFAAPIGASLALAAAGWFYARVRPDPRLASGCLSTAQVIAFAAVAAPLSYLAAAADLPLNDRAYDAIDRALGLDWKAMLDVMNAWPLLFDALRPIYLSLTLQMTSRRSLPRIYRQIRLAVGLYAR